MRLSPVMGLVVEEMCQRVSHHLGDKLGLGQRAVLEVALQVVLRQRIGIALDVAVQRLAPRAQLGPVIMRDMVQRPWRVRLSPEPGQPDHVRDKDMVQCPVQ